MPEQEPLQPQEIEVNQGWASKPDDVWDGIHITLPEKVEPPPPVYLIDGVAHPTDTEPAGFHVTNGVKYANVDEALKHMDNVSAPDSLTIPYLTEKIKVTEDWLAVALTEVSKLSDKVRVLEEAKVETIIK